MMIKWGLICGFWLLFHSTTLGNKVTIELISNGPIVSQPGKVVTVVLKATNNTRSALGFLPGYGLPEGWQPISQLEQFQLPPEESQLKLFSFLIPSNEIPGNYLLEFQLTNRSRSEKVVKFPFSVEVMEVYNINAEALEAPAFVTAGTEISAKFIVRNLGNLPQFVTVKPHSCKVKGETTLYFNPKESKVVMVTAQTYPDIIRESQQWLRIEAFLSGNPEVKTGVTQFVRVIPRANLAVVDDGLRLPVSLQLNYLGRTLSDGEFATGFQGELYVNGKLDEAGDKHLEVKLRGPNRFNAAVSGLYDEYSASLKTPDFNLFVGDKTYHLSQLTEFARYGRGAEASFILNNLELGAFYQKPLFYPDIKSEFASYARLNFTEGNQLSLNFLNKQLAESLQMSTVLSFLGNFRLLKTTQLEAEYSRGNLSREYGSGLRLNLLSKPIDRLQLNLQILSADKDFPGYYNNTKNISGSIAFQLSKKWTVSYLMNQDKSNVAEDTLFATAPFLSRKQAMLGFFPHPNTQLQFSAHRLQVEDRLLPSKFNYNEDFLKLQWVQTLDALRLTVETELGNRKDLLKAPENREVKTLRGNLNAWYQLSNLHSFGAFAQLYSFQQPASTIKKQWILGLSANAILRTNTRINFSIQNNFAQEEYYRNRNLWNVSIQQRFPKNQQLSLSGYYTLLKGSESNADMSFVANYSWQFGVRLNHGSTTQGVSGQILRQGIETVKGIVLHLNGQSVTTDEEGKFYFKNVPPGKYFLLLDPASVGLHIVPSIPTPISTEVVEGATPHLVFGLISSITITGKIELEADQNSLKGLKTRDVIGALVIEAANGSEVYRTLTDENQWFGFPDLRPGKWTVKVLKKELYEGYQFLQDQFELELLPGQREAVIFKVAKKIREIKFQENFPAQRIGN